MRLPLSLRAVSALALSVGAIIGVPSLASAQQPGDPDLADFCDDSTPPVCDLEGYLEALAEARARGEGGGGSLPITGGAPGMLVGIGGGLVVLGGAAFAARRQRSSVGQPDGASPLG